MKVKDFPVGHMFRYKGGLYLVVQLYAAHVVVESSKIGRQPVLVVETPTKITDPIKAGIICTFSNDLEVEPYEDSH